MSAAAAIDRPDIPTSRRRCDLPGPVQGADCNLRNPTTPRRVKYFHHGPRVEFSRPAWAPSLSSARDEARRGESMKLASFVAVIASFAPVAAAQDFQVGARSKAMG